MTEFYAFASNSPYLTFFLFWIVGWTVTTPIAYICRAYNRRLRSKNIAARGWPTNPLMDADGDIVHSKDDE
jgi:hypothetical protein